MAKLLVGMYSYLALALSLLEDSGPVCGISKTSTPTHWKGPPTGIGFKRGPALGPDPR